MLLRFAPLAAALALAATVLPVAADASTVDVKPLASVASGVGLRNGDVYVVQPQAKLVTAFLPDTGAQLRQETLFGDAGVATSVTEAPGRGGVWIGIGSGADRGFGVMSDSPGITRGPSTAAAFGCGPVGMAPDLLNGHMIYSAPLGASACGTHGAGIVDKTGVSLYADPSFPDAYALQWAPGKLFVPAFSDDTLRRYTVGTNTLTLAATAPLPTGSAPDGITLGPGGQVFATLYGTGKVVQLAPDAADGVAPTVVAEGLDHPIGIAADQGAYASGVGPVYVADSGSGRLLRIDEDGTKGWIDLPTGFEPGQVVVKGNDIWVTDLARPRIAHVQETGPILGDHPDVDPATGTVSISVDPDGNKTSLGFVLNGVNERFASWDLDGTGARTVSLKVDGLTPGATYTVDAYANNKRGMTRSAHSATFTYAPPASAPPGFQLPKLTPPSAKPKRPKLSDLVSYAATQRCVPTRTLRLKLKARKAGQATVTRLKVTVGKAKAKSYTAKQLKKALTLKGLPVRGTVKVKVVATLSDKTTVSQTLAYKRCAPKAKHKKA